jgi:hypothetical protein
MEGAKQNGVYGAEDGRIAADAERQRQDRRRRERGVLPECA